MFNLLLTFLLSTLLNFSPTSAADCERFKNGTFKIKGKDGNKDVMITRKGNIQIEEDPNSQVKIKLEVKWISKCSYTLRHLETLQNDNNLPMPTESLLTVNIVETKAKSYIQVTTSDQYKDMEYKSEVFKIN